mgnify:CR=1 FL=1
MSDPLSRLVKEWYEQGHLGQVKEVHAWHGKIRFAPGKYFTMPDAFPPPIDTVPDYLDWNLWQGPVKSKPFNDGFNAATGEYVDMSSAGIVDPAKVTRSGLQNAASIAGMVLTTECIVADLPEKKDSTAPAGAPGMGGDFDY